MKQLIPALIAGIFILAGGARGFFVKDMMSSKPAVSDEGHGEAGGEDGHGEKKEADKKDKGHGGGGHGDASPKSGSLTYYKFSREFVVPVISNKRVDSLVILNLNLEVDSAIADSLYPMDPKLRDNIMTTLVSLSNEGEAMVSITDPANYELIRATVLENLKQLVPEGLENVLILDMAKQHI